MAEVDTDKLLQFIELTEADPPVATNYLKFAGGDVAQAVELFFVS
jgi:hypothetical protein